jgi:3-deoxy-7-phosphoheptulonate synthase
MIVVMEGDAPEAEVESAISYLVRSGFDVHRSSGQSRTILGVVGKVKDDDIEVIRELDGDAKVVRVSEPYQLASRRFRQRSTVIQGDFGTIGASAPWIAIEPIGADGAGVSATTEQPPASASLPYRIAAGRPFDAAVTRSRSAPRSVGALSCLSLSGSPLEPEYPVVFVLREPSWGAAHWILAAERELKRGGPEVILLEAGGEYPSGARTFEIAAIARAKFRTHLPIVVDVPTIAQQSRYCDPVACAAVASGADGVVLRVWVGPEDEIPRAPATLRWDAAVDLAERLRTIGQAVRK